MPTTPVVTDWGTAIMSSVAAALALLLSGIPKIIGFFVILIIGWLIASALATAVAALLRAVKFNDLANRAGLTGFVQNMGVHSDAAGFLANLAKWFVRLIVLVTAFDALGLPAVSQVLQQLLLWLPNLVVALVVLVIGGLAANALASLVRGATAESGLGSPDLLATIARVAVWAFAIVIAVNQIGVAATLVNTLFMAVVGALALALGLAFGLGGRETAAEIVRGWYARGRLAAPQMAQAADAAQHQAARSTDSAEGQSRSNGASLSSAPSATGR
jgi:mechanosensitive ion channel-like protein